MVNFYIVNGLGQNLPNSELIWVPSIHPQAGHLSEKNDEFAVQYEGVHGLVSLPSKQSHCIEVTQCSETFLWNRKCNLGWFGAG